MDLPYGFALWICPTALPYDLWLTGGNRNLWRLCVLSLWRSLKSASTRPLCGNVRVDLHALYEREAEAKLMELVLPFMAYYLKVVIITDKGTHSKGGAHQ
jgi:hypothetical protein